MDGIIDKVIGSYTNDNRDRVKSIVLAVKEKSSEYSAKDSGFFARKTEEFKRRLKNGESKESIMIEALALCCVAILNVNQRDNNKYIFPYDEQIEAAVAMQGADGEGNVIAEMKTGEGKTLVQILCAYLNALDGKSVHIVSSNDYLAGRDFGLNRAVFEYLGLSVGLVQAKTSIEEKQEAYGKDIMFSTVKNIAFDYLRDNTTRDKSKRVITRPFGHIVIDEVDSTLIDEATTPIILSPSEDSEYKSIVDKDRYLNAVKFLDSLKKENIGYAKDPITPGEAIDQFASHPEYVFIYCKWDKSVYLNDKYNGDEVLRNVIYAHYFFHEGEHYQLADKLDENGKVVTKNGKRVKKVNIIDGPTGRIAASKRYMNGIHQAIEAKEAYKAMTTRSKYTVEISDELVALGVCTYADVLGMYEGGVAGMTGTSSEILEEIYHLPTYQVPTRKKNIRIDNSKYYLTKADKYEAIIKDVEECYRIGRPVLIGTTSVNESMEISALLESRGIVHNLLNANNEKIEASIIANAGQFGSVTVATNMAGRGTDIQLGEGVRELGGLHVIGTSRNRSSRVDNQLRGRCSRQGDPGSSTYYSSLEDERVTKYTGKLDAFIRNKLLQRKFLEKKLGHPIRDKSIKTDLIDKSQKSDEITTEAMIQDVLLSKGPLVEQRKRVYAFRDRIFNETDISTLIIDVLNSVLSDINDTNTLKEQFGSYIKIDETEDIETIKGKIKETITRKVKSFAPNSRYQQVMKKIMLKIVDDYWIVQMQMLENCRFQWLTETLDGKDPITHVKLRSKELFNDMSSCVYEEIFAYAFNPNMRYGTYVIGRNFKPEESGRSL